MSVLLVIFFLNLSQRVIRVWCVASLQNSVAILDGFAHLQIEKKEKETTRKSNNKYDITITFSSTLVSSRVSINDKSPQDDTTPQLQGDYELQGTLVSSFAG